MESIKNFLTNLTHLVPTFKTVVFEVSLVIVLLIELYKVFAGMLGAE